MIARCTHSYAKYSLPSYDSDVSSDLLPCFLRLTHFGAAVATSHSQPAQFPFMVFDVSEQLKRYSEHVGIRKWFTS
jgi:hypothetical protein